MKINKFIEELEKFDPELNVVFPNLEDILNMLRTIQKLKEHCSKDNESVILSE